MGARVARRVLQWGRTHSLIIGSVLFLLIGCLIGQWRYEVYRRRYDERLYSAALERVRKLHAEWDEKYTQLMAQAGPQVSEATQQDLWAITHGRTPRYPTDEERAEARRLSKANAGSPSDIIGRAVVYETIPGWIVRQVNWIRLDWGFSFDPNFKFDESTIHTLLDEIPEKHWDRLFRANSLKHGLAIRDALLRQAEQENKLEDAVVCGTTLRMSLIVLYAAAMLLLGDCLLLLILKLRALADRKRGEKLGPTASR